MTTSSWLGQWSRFAETAAFADLPAPVVARAKLTLLDTLGAIVAGQQEEEIAALVARLVALGGSGPAAAVIGTGQRAPAMTAAFLNAVAGTALELDEGNRFARGHPAIHVMPAALVTAQRLGSTGRDFVIALALGYEIGARIGAAAQLRAGYHPHGTWGVVGAAVASAKLHGASAAQFTHVINIASSLSLATSMRTALEGGTVRNAYAGIANQLGLMAWEMAASGFAGERDGVATVFGEIAGRDFKPDAMVEQLGTRWEIARNYFKRHACCRYNHATLDALEAIIAEHGRIDAARVVRIEVDTYAAAAELADPRPHNALAARFSVPYAVAAFLTRGQADVPAFRAEARGDPRILDLAARVTLREDAAMTARLPAERPARVTVTLTDGRVLSAERRSNRGDAVDPYPQIEIEAKFLALTAPVWGVERLVLQEGRRHAVEGLLVLPEGLQGLVVGLLQEALDLFVDEDGHGLAVVDRARHLAAEEQVLLALGVGDRAHLLAHAPLGDHHAGQLGGLLDVVLGTAGDVAADKLLGHAPTEAHAQARQDLAAAQAVAVLLRQRHGHAQRHAARDDGDLVQRVGLLRQHGHERVARLVEGREPALGLGHDHALARAAEAQLVARLLEVGGLDGVAPARHGHERGLVHQRFQVGAGEAGRGAGDLAQLHRGRQAHLA